MVADMTLLRTLYDIAFIVDFTYVPNSPACDSVGGGDGFRNRMLMWHSPRS